MTLQLPGRWWQLVLAVLCCLAAAGPAARAEGNIKVTVVTILATSKNNDVDPKLKAVAKAIHKKQGDLKGFRIANMTCKSTAPGEKCMFKLVENQEALVIVQRGKDNRMTIHVRPPKHGEIVYITVSDKFLPIITRFKTKDNEQLIIAVSAGPCANKK